MREHLLGEIKELRTYDCNIAPCTDCRMCRNQPGCSIEDDMQDIYRYLELCDNVVIASPLYFMELTGSLLSAASRLQTYFSAQYFRNESPLLSRKKGAVLLTGGGNRDCENAFKTSVRLLKSMNVQEIFPAVFAGNTDTVAAKDNREALKAVRRAAEFLSSP